RAGQGQFTFRKSPAGATTDATPVEVPVTITQCPCCGGELRWELTDPVTVTDMPERPQPEVKSYAVEVRRCERCGQRVRGQHPDVAADQYGATAHRVGPRVKALISPRATAGAAVDQRRPAHKWGASSKLTFDVITEVRSDRIPSRLLVSTLIQHYRPACGNTGKQKAGSFPMQSNHDVAAPAGAAEPAVSLTSPVS